MSIESERSKIKIQQIFYCTQFIRLKVSDNFASGTQFSLLLLTMLDIFLRKMFQLYQNLHIPVLRQSHRRVLEISDKFQKQRSEFYNYITFA